MKKFFASVFILFLLISFVELNLINHSQTAPTKKPAKNQNLISKTCPAGYVLVPGDRKYRTSDFCVMKYDAKCADTLDVKTGLAPKPGNSCSGLNIDGGYGGVYKNNGAGCSCLSENNKKVVSTANGYPITYIALADNTNNDAKTLCKSIGGHVITNNEWMTIARNVEKISINWCNPDGTECGASPGAKGKILVYGHSDNENEPLASAGGPGALIAGTDDKPCFGTTTDGSQICGGASSEKRTLALSNGNILWDFAGNVWQWVDAEVMRKDEPESMSNGVIDSGWLKSDYAPGSLPSVITDNGEGPALGYDAMRPSNPSWNASNGVGRIHHFSSPGDTSTVLYGFIRGGNWRHFEDNGAFNIHLSPPVYSQNIDDVGFRCVLDN